MSECGGSAAGLDSYGSYSDPFIDTIDAFRESIESPEKMNGHIPDNESDDLIDRF